MRNQILLDLYKDSRTVFPLSAIVSSSISSHSSRASLLQKMNYYVSTGNLINVRKGIYAKPDYNPNELACAIYAPSYISLEYVLQKAGVILRNDDTMTCISYLSRIITIDDIEYRFRKIKNEIFLDTRGIISEGSVSIATPERAFLDMMYLESEYHFDDLRPLDKEKVFALLPIYKCKKLSSRVSAMFI